MTNFGGYMGKIGLLDLNTMELGEYPWTDEDRRKYVGGKAVASKIMYASSIVFLIPIAVHHVICGLVEWFYIRLGKTNEVSKVVFEFQKKTISTMLVGYLGLAVFLITLFVMVVSGKTNLPAWACVFNTLPFMIILMPFKFASKGNIAGALMFLGLVILI